MGRGVETLIKELRSIIGELKETADKIRAAGEKADIIMGEVKTKLKEQKEKLKQTRQKFEAVSMGITKSREDTDIIHGKASDCDQAREQIVDIVQNLSAISEENAASTEETTASMEELNATISILASSAREFKELASILEQNVYFFKL